MTFNQAQTELSRTVYQYLADKGYLPRFDEEELEAICQATTSRQPPMLADLFIEHNGEDDFTPLKESGYTLCTNPTYAVVEATHQGGGIALIAHPGRTDGFVTFDAELLDRFKAEIPIDGIEIYYPKHTSEQVENFKAYAEQHNWFVSAGSDSHAPDKSPIKYRAEQCKALLERLDIKVS